MAFDYGYDADFTDPPAEYMKCSVCFLVLNQPVQLATCGHRYCSTCYNRVKASAAHHSKPFTCPVDRTVIDESKVFEDIGMERIVLGLKVRCSSHEKGCKWCGELRDLQTHKSQCPHALKEGEISQLKVALQRLEDKVDQRGKDIKSLKSKNREFKRENESLKKMNKDLVEGFTQLEIRLRKLEDEIKKKDVSLRSNQMWVKREKRRMMLI